MHNGSAVAFVMQPRDMRTRWCQLSQLPGHICCTQQAQQRRPSRTVEGGRCGCVCRARLVRSLLEARKSLIEGDLFRYRDVKHLWASFLRYRPGLPALLLQALTLTASDTRGTAVLALAAVLQSARVSSPQQSMPQCQRRTLVHESAGCRASWIRFLIAAVL